MTTPETILFCWSGGKDSAMALHSLLQRKQFQVVALLTTVTETYDRVAMHGVRRELLKQQAQSIGLPLHEVFIPLQCVNPIYEARMEEAFRLFHTFVFDGSIFHSPIPIRTGEIVNRDGFVFCDLLPELEETLK